MEIAKFWVIQNGFGEFYRMTSTGNWFFDKNFSKAKNFQSKGRAEVRMNQLKEMIDTPGYTLEVRSVTVTLD